MRVTKAQIVSGIASYIQQEILPKMGDDKALQIVFSVAVNVPAVAPKEWPCQV